MFHQQGRVSSVLLGEIVAVIKKARPAFLFAGRAFFTTGFFDAQALRG